MTSVDTLKQDRAREVVLRRIQTGTYRPGQRLPSQRELAQDLGMSHIAIRRGLEDLVQAGLIVRRPRVGVFVQQTRPLELADRIGIVVPHYMGKAHPFLPVLMSGVLSGLNQRDSDISLFTYQNHDQFWNQAGEAMLARGIRGAVIYTGYKILPADLQRLERSGIHAVLMRLSGEALRCGISTISVDFRIAMAEIMQRLTDLGHRRIVWMAYTESGLEDFEEDVLRPFCEKYGLDEPSRMIRRLSCEPCDYTGWRDVLGGPNHPTAVVLQDEFMAHEIFHVIRQLGLHVPDDLSLVSLADSLPRSHPVALSAPDTITTWTDAACRAAEHVRYLVENQDNRVIEVALHAAIQWKASTAKAPET